VASPNDSTRIGPRLRRRRREVGLSIADLAEATDLTKGFISLLERDLASASVGSLVRICDALEMRVGSLFEPPRSSFVQAGARSRINFGGENVTEWLLTPAKESRLQVIETRLAPGGNSGNELYSLPAEAEFVHVLEGTIEVQLGEKDYRLKTGDSLTFPADQPHAWHNPSDKKDALVLWVLIPAIS
jgi:quercetin dioxygenase-like cupin family protein/DNA-binding XRE family transcriptional regulator